MGCLCMSFAWGGNIIHSPLVCWRSSPNIVLKIGTIFGLKLHEKLNPKQGMGNMELGRKKNITSKEGHVSMIGAPLIFLFLSF
jgi:hypothetical protein